MGEHRHPALVERFTVLEGELTVKLAGQTTAARARRLSSSRACGFSPRDPQGAG
jgi:hypothetical protein